MSSIRGSDCYIHYVKLNFLSWFEYQAWQEQHPCHSHGVLQISYFVWSLWWTIATCILILTLISTWIGNHIPSKGWDEITYQFPTFSGCTVEAWKWISNFIPHFMMDVITNTCCDYSQSLLVRGPMLLGTAGGILFYVYICSGICLLGSTDVNSNDHFGCADFSFICTTSSPFLS